MTESANLISRPLLIFVATLMSHLADAQVVVLFHMNDQQDFHGKRIERIDEVLRIGSYSIHYHKEFNAQNMVVLDERHNQQGKFVARYRYEYTSEGTRVTRKTKEFLQDDGSTLTNIEEFSYDEIGHLSRWIYYHGNGTIASVTQVQCNNRGHPIELKEFNKDGSRTIGKTVIRYDYINNIAYHQKYGNTGNLLDSGRFTIDYDLESQNAKEGFEYNDNGILVKYPNGFANVENDQYGNWTLIRRFRLVDNKDVFDQEQTRKIKYHEKSSPEKVLEEDSPQLPDDSIACKNTIERFYEWYNELINSKSLSDKFNPKFARKDDGKTKLEFDNYIKGLREHHFSEEYIQRLVRNFESCTKNLGKVKFEEFLAYKDLDDFEELKCAFTNQYEFFGGMLEPIDGFEIGGIKNVSKKRIESPIFFYDLIQGGEKKYYAMKGIAAFVRNGAGWLIDDIRFEKKDTHN